MKNKDYNIICKMLKEDADNIEIDMEFKQNLKKRIMEKALKDKELKSKEIKSSNRYYKHLKIASALIAVSLIGSAATMSIANNENMNKNIANSNNINTVEKSKETAAQVPKEKTTNNENKKEKPANTNNIKNNENKNNTKKQKIKEENNLPKPNNKSESLIAKENNKTPVKEENKDTLNKVIIDGTIDYGNDTNSIIKKIIIKGIDIQKSKDEIQPKDKSLYIQRKNSEILLYDKKNNNRYVFSKDELGNEINENVDKIFSKDSIYNLISLSANSEETQLSILAENDKEEYEIVNLSIEKK
ncbi:hypothetical protein CLOACE_15150 [Clostridium acetireducens DSM 10703]|uniref:Uncharacterized protein n=1 Tax=Clostridium acetireducens DSM 10703 TaxID=1121290 RepID=A0A1E8EY16_9CLOT|nr:hypothetical protein [Clostridium acetireducens]OFI05820.1 hypothetical protein CLOACE_15150 [Clostridium acetireducens DSM 10703]